MYIRRTAPDFIRRYPHALSAVATEWLTYIEFRDAITIQNARNGGEYRSGGYCVDGFCEATNTVYQFQGCFYHGESSYCTLQISQVFKINFFNTALNQQDNIYNTLTLGCERCFPNDRDIGTKKRPSYAKKFERTQKMTQYHRDQGYVVIEKWECQWKQERKQLDIPQVYNYPFESKYRMTERELKKALSDGELFGVVECDVRVREDMREHFSEFCPIFKNTDVTVDDIGEHMKLFCERTKSQNSFTGRLF